MGSAPAFAGAQGLTPLPLIPGGGARCYTDAVVCSDGTWMAPSDVHVQTAGAWTESEMARNPGARANQ